VTTSTPIASGALADTLTFIDTNVFIYAVDVNEPLKRRRAVSVLSAAPAGTLVTSTQVLGEFFVAATRKLRTPLSYEVARGEVERIAPLARIAVDRKLVVDAIALCAEASISYWDALIVRAAAALDCDRLLTEDLQAGQQIDGVLIVNPFGGDQPA
jgi:predicted nucleic acid-binding protein